MKMVLTLAASALALAGSVAVSQAQQSPAGPMQQDRPGMMQQLGEGAQSDQQGSSPSGMQGMMGRGHGPGMMDSDRRGRHGGGHHRMGPGMMVMVRAIMDTDGDGALSLEEVQAVHARMFNYVDADDDGRLTPEELQSFFHGGAFER